MICTTKDCGVEAKMVVISNGQVLNVCKSCYHKAYKSQLYKEKYIKLGQTALWHNICYNRGIDGDLDPSKYKPIGVIKCQTERI